MNAFFKGVGAFIYSVVQSWLINLIIVGLIFIAFKIFSLSDFWIFIILFFLGGLIEVFRDIILAIIALPYAWLAKNSFKILILPGISLIINAIGVIYKIWSLKGFEGTIGIIVCVFVTYEAIMLTYKSIYVMIAVSFED